MTIAADSQAAAQKSPRILLIDTLRGIALIAMATYHLTWDLEFFGYLDPGTATQGFFRIYARSIASSFLFLAGVSLVLAHGRTIRWPSFWKRLAIVAGAALAISVATYVAFPHEWIYFGILHNIAVSSVIGLLFLRLPLTSGILVPLLIVAAMIANASIAPGILSSPAFDTRWLSWLGFAELPPRSNDYVPLFPWLAALLAGVAIARIALARGWNFRLADIQRRDTLLAKAGRHSLIVYLVHQPVLIALVYLASLVAPPPAVDPRESYVSSCQMSCVKEADEATCRQFCGCTADALISQNLMTPMQSGTISAQDDRIQMIAQECSISLPQQ
ncbi:Uncharacterized membrane protein [Rhizobium sp. NFR07]|uniref:heparan-alpha-glucosaminide N-acetyltransferase n=1 Tax=Rhizobium sp. NFR07 TaxID=1566262 RepID=UPI0008E814DB|nr:heparan-alpha-glucosaminide N-acetyltransferase [Rhizobium sp. NFR07]SFB37180.1 Uncharacterized membrane protein [Rhizobium sp. NFR07]